jgi:WD40 repeat protein
MIAQSIEAFPEIGTPVNPFPGLRPFEFDESHLFFGRDGQSEQLISKLGRTRFLAVVGTSGSGKSSLVRAGLLPTLLGGFMTSAGSDWRISIMRPGNDPIGNLAQVLNAPDVFGSEIEGDAAIQTAITEATLRRGSLGLVDLVRQAAMPANENLLVVADQFEEIFRFARVAEGEAYRNEAAAFVKLILEATQQREIPIYVVLTMRSDYLGDCAEFWDLPEAINESQYLIPRLTRDQLREAIAGPVAVGSGKITPRLVNRLLNDVGDNQDQLPVLQHLLMRAWSEWKEKRLEVGISDGVVRPHKEAHESEAMDLCCSEAVGGMAQALSRHADEAYNELPDDRHRAVAEKVFKALTEKGPDNREIRRPIMLSEICAIAAATPAEVSTIIETFRRPGRSFLMPPAEVELNSESMIDISHESLIRGWMRLKDWVEDEARSARIYKRAADAAMLHKAGEDALLTDPALQVALDWRDKSMPNAAWARRYHPEFEGTMNYLAASVAARDAEARDREQQHRKDVSYKRTRLTALLLLVSLLFAVGASVYAYKQRKLAADEAMKNGRLFYSADINLAQQAYEAGDLERARDLLSNHPPAPGETPFEWYYLSNLLHLQMEKETLEAPGKGLLTVTTSFDGKTVAIGAGPVVELRSIAAGETERATIPLPEGFSIGSLAFSPDDKRLAVGDAANQAESPVVIYDTKSLKPVSSLPKSSASANTLVFTPDGKSLIVGGGDGVVSLWAVSSSPRKLNHTQLHGTVTVAVSLTGKMAAFTSADSKRNTFPIVLWDLSANRRAGELIGHRDAVTSVVFTTDGKSLASGSSDKTVRLWDVARRQQQASVSFTNKVFSLAFSPDDHLLAIGCEDGGVKLLDTTTKQVSITLRGHHEAVTSLAFTANGQLLFSCDNKLDYEEDASVTFDDEADDTAIKSWDIASLIREQTPATSVGIRIIRTVAYAEQGSTLVVVGRGSAGNEVILLDTETNNQLRRFPLRVPSPRLVALSPDGRLIATAARGSATLLNGVSADPIGKPLEHGPEILLIAFSPDGKRLATVAAGGVRLWDTASQDLVKELNDQTRNVLGLAFSPDGRYIALVYGDMLELRDKDLANPRQIKIQSSGEKDSSGDDRNRSVRAVAVSPKGRVCAIGDDEGQVVLIETKGLKVLATLKTAATHSLAFSPDGNHLVTGGGEGAVKLWDMVSFRELLTLGGDAFPIVSVAFSPDGRTLATADFQTLRLWRAPVPVGAVTKKTGGDNQ